MADTNRSTTTGTTTGTTGAGTWDAEDTFWRSSYNSRPYAKADRDYSHYQPAYRYGWESANRYSGRDWNAVENDLRSGWDRYEHRGASKSAWEEVKDAAKDAWDRVRGHGDPHRRDRP